VNCWSLKEEWLQSCLEGPGAEQGLGLAVSHSHPGVNGHQHHMDTLGDSEVESAGQCQSVLLLCVRLAEKHGEGLDLSDGNKLDLTSLVLRS